MDFAILAKRAGKVAADNSPTLLTTLGVTGALTTAYLAGKASFRAADVLREAELQANKDRPLEDIPLVAVEEVEALLTFKEKVDLVWKLYIPAAAMATMTVVCIVGANRVGTSRTAALAAAYSISEKAAAEYKAKVVEKVGKNKEQAIRSAVAQDQVDKHPINNTTVIVTNRGNARCLDMYSKRYFDGDVQSIHKAVNDFNARIINDGYASLSEFWDLLGIPATSMSDHVGWSTDKLLDIVIDAAISAEDEQPVITVDFRNHPVSRYDRSY